MSASPETLTTPALLPLVPAPMCLLYTMLRHGRGLSHEEATRRINDTLGEALAHTPAQAF